MKVALKVVLMAIAASPVAALAWIHAWWFAAYLTGGIAITFGTLRLFRRQLLWLIAGVLLLSSALGLRWLWVRSPQEGQVTSWRADVGRRTRGNMIPEHDLVVTALHLFPHALGWALAPDLASSLERDYDAIDRDPEMRGLESVLRLQAGSQSQRTEFHYFLVLPDRPPPPGGFPMLLFLHGFGGNLQIYAHWMKALADRRGIAAIIPTGPFAGALPKQGFGEITALSRLVEDARFHAPIAPSRTVIIKMRTSTAEVSERSSTDGYPRPRLKEAVGVLAVAESPDTWASIRTVSFEPWNPDEVAVTRVVLITGGRNRDQFASVLAGVKKRFNVPENIDDVMVEGDYLAVLRDPVRYLGVGLDKLCALGADVCK
jgi:hypothetical protein